MRSVCIRGYGIVSAYGAGSDALVAGIGAGAIPRTVYESAVTALRGISVSALPSGAAARSETGAVATMMRAIEEALARAGAVLPLDDCALICGGTSVTAMAEDHHFRLQRETPGGRARVYDPGYFTQVIARELGIRGPVMTLSTSCSSSANAMLVARDLILRGRVTRALVLGIEALANITLSGFQSLMMLDAHGCRPFDVERAGLQIGEGAAALLLEAEGPGARLLGGANLCDIHHVTSASPDGSGMARCMHAALADSGVAAADIIVTKAHGTASRENDAAEAAAMHTVFGASLPPFTALKRYLGHTLGACGAVETVAMLAALDRGFVPAAAGFAQADAALRCAPMRERLHARAGNYLLNFFGFGGNYASLVVRHG